MLPRCQNDPDRRRVLDRVKGQHLDRLDDVEPLAVAAEVRSATPTRAKFPALSVEKPHFLGPPTAPRRGGVGNSLMQVKGERPGASLGGTPRVGKEVRNRCSGGGARALI